MANGNENLLGIFLKDRRARLDPASFGIPLSRRRTPGLRREEVAQRAHVSATWYTWLEQGRGGAPSADVLDRIARALMLTEAEREHLFLLGLGRPPERQSEQDDSVSPRLQSVLDAMPFSPAFIRNHMWDVLAWNHAAAAVLTDYAKLAADNRNIIRLIFSEERVRAAQPDWEHVARSVVAAFRGDVARGGMTDRARAFVDDMCRRSPEFEALWRENDVQKFGSGTKHIVHREAGPLVLDFSAFAVDGRPDLGMVVYNPATAEDLKRVREIVLAASSPGGQAAKTTPGRCEFDPGREMEKAHQQIHGPHAAE